MFRISGRQEFGQSRVRKRRKRLTKDRRIVALDDRTDACGEVGSRMAEAERHVHGAQIGLALAARRIRLSGSRRELPNRLACKLEH
jgi:hypothetical protein